MIIISKIAEQIIEALRSESLTTFELSEKIVKQLIPAFVDKGLKVNLKPSQIERVTELLKRIQKGEVSNE